MIQRYRDARRWTAIPLGLVLLAFIGTLTSCMSTAEERSPGEMAFRANCQTCHVLPRAEKYTDEQWPALVERYGTRAKLNAEKIALITEYLQRVNNK
jgi:hypothetical protein